MSREEYETYEQPLNIKPKAIKFTTDSNGRVTARLAEGGSLSEQSVSTLILLAILRLLERET